MLTCLDVVGDMARLDFMHWIWPSDILVLNDGHYVLSIHWYFDLNLPDNLFYDWLFDTNYVDVFLDHFFYNGNYLSDIVRHVFIDIDILLNGNFDWYMDWNIHYSCNCNSFRHLNNVWDFPWNCSWYWFIIIFGNLLLCNISLYDLSFLVYDKNFPAWNLLHLLNHLWLKFKILLAILKQR